ncbi:MAG: S-adenosylmethionine:tRNA ribosyltransferase-isomerase [Candidatus Eremiobacteraeota bacterium]|nr:S-adenosylmethionine:tRNA ribosyltransferase-isomerase [Candidatus Eremiobacteraeota bacterium]MBC5822948.1 S-adenosylmethionine:tRNA ribosyltransferase-isomerase [Candidatus Eremiobacteraeota bacterium]
MLVPASSSTSFDFTVPPELEARAPAEQRGLGRDDVRLLVSRSGHIEHASFRGLPMYLESGDLLVANDSATFPGSLAALAVDGRPVEIHVATHIAGSLWIVEPRACVTRGERFELHASGHLTVLERVAPPHQRLWYATLSVSGNALAYLMRYGLPIRYGYADAGIAPAAYQTIFAREPGSAELPSAGRPFVAQTLAALRARGVELASVTLHCGVSSPEAHEPPAPERYVVPPATVRAVRSARAAGGRVIAIGTTVVRALETAALGGELISSQGWSELLVTPAHPPQIVDGLLTGFHEPRASHLQLVRAFLDDDDLRRAYAAALEERYLWHEFGDVHLVLRAPNRRHPKDIQ